MTVGGIGSRYGPLQDGFAYTIKAGYSVLVGANNSGKSSILQLAFRQLVGDEAFGRNAICLIPPDRGYIQASTETGGRSLETYNTELQQYIGNTPQSFDNPTPPDRSELARLLITHTDYAEQLARLNELLARLGFPRFVLRTAQLAHFEDVAVQLQGSGLRGLLPILCALTTNVRIVLLDEPEISLEPALQRPLRDLLIEEAHDRAILVATHSHLFLNRRDFEANDIVRREGTIVSVTPVASEEQLHDVVFELLGNSTQDLFFPGNFAVVEGAADQVMLERAIELVGATRGQVKVLAASGVDRAASVLAAVVNALTPLVTRDSPYARRVVALLDQRNDTNARQVEEVGRVLGDRLFELDAPSLEEYLPEELYARAGRERADDLAAIAAARHDQRRLGDLKRVISEQIAAILMADDLPLVPIIAAAARRAALGAGSGDDAQNSTARSEVETAGAGTH